MFVLSVVILAIIFVQSNCVRQEQKCANAGGNCQYEDECDGTTRVGLCPTQPRNVKCCFSDNNAISDSGSNSCGCSYDIATGCSGGPTAGATRLANHFKSKFGGRTEIYNCRRIRGGSGYSLHAEGRAVDFYPSGNRGRAAFDYAVSIACQSGIQEVIFNRRIWVHSKGEYHYSGSNPHTDHVHIGLNRCGAANFDI